MDSWQVIEHLEKHPAMFGLDGTFREIVAFLEGFDVAKEGAVLGEFQRWLVVELGVGNNLAWSALVRRSAFPGDESIGSRWRDLSPAEDREAVRVLFDSLARYKADLLRPDGVLRIYDAYLKWMRRQVWYEAGSPHYLD